jgi:outer membrane protein assembly factor BamB
VAVLLSSCELLSANGGQKKKEENKKSRPELVWQSGTVSRSEVPPPVIEDSSVYVVNGYALAKLNLNNGENRWVTELEGVAPDIYGDILVDGQSIYLRFGESLKRYDKLDGAL